LEEEMNPTTDLAARFEAKREECAEHAQQAYDCGDEVNSDLLRAKANAFAETRDMARAGAAEGAEGFVLLPSEPTESMYAAAYPWFGSSRFNFSDMYHAMTAAAPHPPAQQGSSSPPLTAARGDLGELERLSAAATAGPWEVSGIRRTYNEPISVCVDAPSCYGLFGLATRNGKAAFEAMADAHFIVKLVNAYRSGHLVPASLPAGTGSAEEGTDLGAPATPSGHSRAEPSGLGPLAECPSRGRLAVPGKQIIADLAQALEDIRHFPTQEDPGDDGIHMRNLAEMALWGLDRASKLNAEALGIEARQGRDEGSVEDESPARRATPTPDPVREAKALLEGLDPLYAPEEHVRILRGMAKNWLGRRSNYCSDQASAIEAALATLHASQDQAGEVRS
jgi:hypothetical protein